MTQRLHRVLALIVVLLAQGCAGRAREAGAPRLTIAQDGKSDYVIVTSASPSPPEALAAEELAKYLRRMSGAALHVQRGGSVPDAAIVVCDAANRTALGSTNDIPVQGEGYAVHGQGKRLYIVGGRGRGTLYGVYAVLDALGCRFLAPNFDHYQGTAEVIPQRATITVTPAITTSPRSLLFTAEGLDAGSRPKLAYRKLYVEEGHSHDEANLRQLIEWMPKVGYNILVVPTDYQGRGRVKWDNWREALTPELQRRDLIIEVGGHGYQNFMNAAMEGGELFARHPEWFGQDDQGRRTKQVNRVFCTSNGDAVAYLTSNFLKYVKERPEIQIFDFWPPDGARWCTCDECKKLGEPPERQARLVSHVQQEVAKVRPDLQLEAIAYSSLIEPPRQVKMDPSVLIDFCPIAQNFEFTIDDPRGHETRSDGATPRANAQYFNALKAWREVFAGPISIYSYYRRYAWDSLPMQLPRHMKHELAFYASVPTQGISVYSEPGDWYTYELNHYVLPALAWDKDRDVAALVKKFCDARYGAASGVAQSALRTLEDVVHVYCSIPFVSLKGEREIDAAAGRVDDAAKDVDAAVAAADGDALKRNLGRLRLMLEYARRDLGVQKMRAANAPREQIRQRIAADHKFLSDRADQGVFLVKNNRLNLARAHTRYGVGDKPPPTRPAE